MLLLHTFIENLIKIMIASLCKGMQRLLCILAAFCHSALGSVVRTRTCQVKSKSLAKKTRKTIQSHIMCSFETGEDCNLPPKEKLLNAETSEASKVNLSFSMLALFPEAARPLTPCRVQCTSSWHVVAKGIVKLISIDAYWFAHGVGKSWKVKNP